MSSLEALSYAIDWPTVGRVGFVFVAVVAVVWVVYEVTGEIKRRRRLRRWESRR